VLLVGVPTAHLPTPWFRRAVPPRPRGWIVLILTALLCAALAATYALPVACPPRERSLTAGGLLSFFAIGYPACNKLAVLTLGWGGALTYFAPLQPALGALALATHGGTLVARLRAVRLALVLSPFGFSRKAIDRAARCTVRSFCVRATRASGCGIWWARDEGDPGKRVALW